MASIQRLFVHFGHFFGGNAVALVLGLLTFPILTRLLTQEEYGALGLINSTIAVMVALSKAGLSDGIIRFYRDFAADPDRLRLFTSTVLLRGILLATVVTVLYLIFIPRFNLLVGVDAQYTTAFLIMGLFLFIRPLNIIVLNYLRAVGKTLLFNATNIVTRFGAVGLSIGLLLYTTYGLDGYFVGIVLGELIGSVILFRWLFRNYVFSPTYGSRSLAWSLIRFGAPLLLTELAYLLLRHIDRYLIVAYHGEAMLGIYTVGYNIPSYINDLVMFPLSYAIVPLYTDLYAKGLDQTRAFLNRALNYYFIGVIPLCVGYTAISADVITILASAKYAEAAAFSPLILVGLTFLGVNSILNAGLYLTKRSLHMLIVMVCAAAVNVGLNLWLLPTLGATGAALATVAAGVASTITTVLLAFRYISLRIEPSTIIYYLTVSGIMYVALAFITVEPTGLRLVTKLACGAAIVGTAALYREAELRRQVRRLAYRLTRPARRAD